MTYLIFDLDGTLTEPFEGISKSILYALEKSGYPPCDEVTLRECIGPPLFYSFTRIFGMSEEMANRAVLYYRERYHTLGWRENALLPHVKEGLEKLHEAGYVLAVATGKPTLFAERILFHFGVRKYLATVVGSELDGSLGKKVEEINEVLFRLNADKGECLMIGDRKYDIEGAKQAEIASAGLYCGYAEEGELEKAGADRVFPDFPSLVEALLVEKNV